MKITYGDTVQFQNHEGTGHLVLGLPPSNAMTPGFFKEFNHAIDDIQNNGDVRALVISGNGRHFSSGADLPALFAEIEEHSTFDSHGKILQTPGTLQDNHRSFLKLESMTIPVICAIRGVCLGSALELALSCHFRFCGEDAVFGLPEATYNLIPGLDGIRNLSAITGKANALELILTGKTIPAFEALAYGIVDRVFPKREVVKTSLGFALRVMNGFQKEKRKMYLKKIFPI